MRDSEELLRLIYEAVVEAGIDIEAVDQALEFSCKQMGEPSHRARHTWQIMFWNAVEDVTGNPDIGLHLCPYMPVFRGHIIEYLFLSSRSFREGCDLALDYVRLVSDAFTAELSEDDGGARIEMTGTSGEAPVLRHSEICFVFGVIRFMQHVTANAFVPQSVRLCCDPISERAAYERIFGCPVTFGGERSEIQVHRGVLDMDSPHYDPELLALHKQYADRKLAELTRQDLIDQVRARLIGHFGRDEPAQSVTLADVAQELNLATRYVRTELANAGTSFRHLVKSARFSVARRLLRESNAAVEQVAAITGFSEPAAFYRAFKGWAGVTPCHYRRHNGPAGKRARPLHSVLSELSRTG